MTPEEYLKRPYTYCLVWDEESKTWTGTIKEFPGCIAQNIFAGDCKTDLRYAAIDWIEAALELGQEIPEPEAKLLDKAREKPVKDAASHVGDAFAAPDMLERLLLGDRLNRVPKTMPKWITYPEHIAEDLTAANVETPTCAHPDCLGPGSPVEFRGLCVKCLAAMGRRVLINRKLTWRRPPGTHSILPTENIAAFQAVDRLIEMGYRRFRLTYVCCVSFPWAAEINGPYNDDLGDRPHYGGSGATREEAICSMVVKVLEG